MYIIPSNNSLYIFPFFVSIYLIKAMTKSEQWDSEVLVYIFLIIKI